MSAYVVIDIESTGKNALKDELLCVGIGRSVYPPEEGRRLARMAMVRPGTVLVAHTNFDLRWLMLEGAKLGRDVHYHDTKVMAWLLDGTQPLDLESLTKRYCKYTPDKRLFQRGNRVWFRSETVGDVFIEETPWDELAAYNRSDLEAEGDLYEALRDELRKSGQWHHFLTEEAPFSRLLLEMESVGMPFNREAAMAMLSETEREWSRLRGRLVALTGAENFNPGSGEQVARFLYTDVWTQEIRFPIPRLAGKTPEEKAEIVEAIKPARTRVTRIGREYAYGELLLEGMGLKPPKRGKHQKTARPSVNGKTLSVLYGDNPWVAEYIEWRRYDKLAGYLRDWIARAHHGKLYGRFDQSGTVTGRLAAREPNLQQVATEGPVRGLFRGDLVVGDYAGLEVRLSAHFSLEPVMLDIFESGGDLYGTLAARAWGGPADKENEGRGLMKVLMLASQYGAGPEQIAELLAIAGLRGYGVKGARALLKDFEALLPRLFAWRKEVIAQAEKDGYVTTLAGRRRRLAGINSAAWELKGKAERQAVNSMVQGSAADIVRRAMLAARKAVDPSVARICLQVHDEIIWTRGPEWSDEAFSTLVDVCQHAHGFELAVPLTFEAKVAESWGEKEGTSGQVHAGAYQHLEEVTA